VEQIFISGADDGKVYVWDNAKNGEEQSRRDYEDGPPELVFHHMTHSSNIEDISWCPQRPIETGLFPMIASVETQRVVQVWKPKQDFFENDTDLINNVDLIADEDLE
jgi:WD40 repeat protein